MQLDLNFNKDKFQLNTIKKIDSRLLSDMKDHYSKPKGFVGRTICYQITYDDVCYGHIVGGSATRFLPNRKQYLNTNPLKILNNIVNNIFFHVTKQNKTYPIRNFTSYILKVFEKKIVCDWYKKYGDKVIALETLVELPRTGECYKRTGWEVIGVTKGYQCRRTGGYSDKEKFGGVRIWETKNLKPKLAFMKTIKEEYNHATT